MDSEFNKNQLSYEEGSEKFTLLGIFVTPQKPV